MPENTTNSDPSTSGSQSDRTVRVTVRVETLAKNELPGIAHGVVRTDATGTALDVAHALLSQLTEGPDA